MRYQFLIPILVALLPAAAFADKAPEVPPAPVFRIECKKAGDLTDQSTAGKTVFSIKNSGIGRAVISCKAAQWPQDITLRIHLRGLESLSITNGQLAWNAAVSSSADHLTLQQLQGQSLTKNSPHWAEIRRFSAEGKPVAGLPPAGGWFELHIPATLLANSRRLEISWIDFYR